MNLKDYGQSPFSVTFTANPPSLAKSALEVYRIDRY